MNTTTTNVLLQIAKHAPIGCTSRALSHAVCDATARRAATKELEHAGLIRSGEGPRRTGHRWLLTRAGEDAARSI